MSRVKGSNFASLRAFTDKRGATERLRASLPPDALAAFDSALVIGWYPAPVFLAAIHALAPALGETTSEAMRAYGFFAAEHDLTTLHRAFFRLANPAYVLEKSTQYWSRFHDEGEWKVTRETPKSARGELVGCGIVDALFCETLTAYITRLFALVGAKEPRWTHPICRARGGKSCLFVGEWT
jgi:hypothetical protein